MRKLLPFVLLVGACTSALTPMQAKLWRYMERHPGVGLRQIKEHMGRSMRVVIQLQERLINKGLAERVVKPGNMHGVTVARRSVRFADQLRDLDPGIDAPSVPRVDPRQRRLLECIAEEPGQTTNELMAAFGTQHRRSIAAGAERLVAVGAIEVVGGFGRQRSNRYLPTSAGVRALDHLRNGRK